MSRWLPARTMASGGREFKTAQDPDPGASSGVLHQDVLKSPERGRTPPFLGRRVVWVVRDRSVPCAGSQGVPWAFWHQAHQSSPSHLLASFCRSFSAASAFRSIQDSMSCRRHLRDLPMLMTGGRTPHDDSFHTVLSPAPRSCATSLTPMSLLVGSGFLSGPPSVPCPRHEWLSRGRLLRAPLSCWQRALGRSSGEALRVRPRSGSRPACQDPPLA